MTTKKTLSIIALIATLMSTNAFAVRVANPRIISELNKFYAHMKSQDRLGELSKEARSVCSCIKRGAEFDQDVLIKAIREAQSHGFLVRAHAHPSLLAPRGQSNQR